MEASEQKDISSAEITAHYRTAIPEISGDKYSQLLTSEAGRIKASAFIDRYHYPLVNRKVSARAGYLLLEANRLLTSGYYDSVISFASGFSMLLYCIAERNLSYSAIQYFDSDLPHMIYERNKRIEVIKDKLNPIVFNRLNSFALDLEKACLNKRKLKELFPNCEKPIFIIEGVIYFLSNDCVNWLIDEMGSYRQTAVLLDYWPEDMQSTSQKFREAFKDINTIIPEQTKSFWDVSTMNKFTNLFPSVDVWTIADVDAKLSAQGGLLPALIHPDEYFPLKMITAQKGKISADKFPHVKLSG